ncbi:MAG: hypothetical protein JXR84_04145 [Anaerolineae bacterium]|nr:hypothetical protein [Anaerolineae bacterium]
MNIIELLIKVTGSNNAKGSLTDLKSGLDMVSGALGKLKEAGVAAFEFAEAGAKVAQTRKNFDDLGMSIGTLRNAVGGTVSDMTLMSGTLTLTAGASATMQKAYKDAVPELLSMAKAASKLNPTLGDTAFMYQSLSTAAKKQSTMIADNLGIVVKQETAYQNYAKSVNKSVESLSAEEKQLAFLNELMRQGNVLVDQAGGNVASLTDNYDRMRANLENATDGLKQQAEVAGGVVDVLATLTGRYAEWYEAANATGRSVISWNSGIEATRLVLTGTNAAIQEYNANLAVQGRTMGTARDALVAYAATYEEEVTPQAFSSMDAMNQYNMAIQMQSEATAKAAAEQIALAEAERAVEEAGAAAATASLQFAAGLGEMGAQAFVNLQLETLNGLYKEGEIDLHTYRSAQLELMKQSGMLTQSELNAMNQMNGLNGSLADGSIRASEYAARVLTLHENINKLQDKTIRIKIETEGGIPSLGAGPESRGTVGAFAEGGSVTQSQIAWVGERGPELVRLPAGAYVHTAAESERMASGSVQVHAPVTVYAQIAGEQDVDRLADQISEIIGRRVQSYA